MTREELTARLAECEGHTPEGWINDLGDIRESADGPVIATVWNRKDQERTNKDTALVRLAPALASALREAWAEIDRMKLSWDSAEAQIDDVDDELRDVVKENAALRKKLHEAGINPSLDQALNEGDGAYRP